MPDTFAELCATAAADLGFSRPAGQIFGTVFGATAAPTADDLCAELGLSRSNVSTALKELRIAGLVSVTRIPGDRKEYFTAPSDVWEIVQRLVATRRRRLLDPLLDGLGRAVGTGDVRAGAVLGAVESLSNLADSVVRVDPAVLGRLASSGLPVDARRKEKKRKKKG